MKITFEQHDKKVELNIDAQTSYTDNDMFSLFRVYDYKGGELRSITNLPIDDLCAELFECSVVEELDDEYSAEQLMEMNNASIKKLYNNVTKIRKSELYAGCDNLVYRIYHHADNKLRSVDESQLKPFIFKKYINDLIEYGELDIKATIEI